MNKPNCKHCKTPLIEWNFGGLKMKEYPYFCTNSDCSTFNLLQLGIHPIEKLYEKYKIK